MAPEIIYRKINKKPSPQRVSHFIISDLGFSLETERQHQVKPDSMIW